MMESLELKIIGPSQRSFQFNRRTILLIVFCTLIIVLNIIDMVSNFYLFHIIDGSAENNTYIIKFFSFAFLILSASIIVYLFVNKPGNGKLTMLEDRIVIKKSRFTETFILPEIRDIISHRADHNLLTITERNKLFNEIRSENSSYWLGFTHNNITFIFCLDLVFVNEKSKYNEILNFWKENGIVIAESEQLPGIL